jgi:hypothetical protein
MLEESRSSENHIALVTNGKCIISEAEEAIVRAAGTFFRRQIMSIFSDASFTLHLRLLTGLTRAFILVIHSGV